MTTDCQLNLAPTYATGNDITATTIHDKTLVSNCADGIQLCTRLDNHQDHHQISSGLITICTHTRLTALCPGLPG